MEMSLPVWSGAHSDGYGSNRTAAERLTTLLKADYGWAVAIATAQRANYRV